MKEKEIEFCENINRIAIKSILYEVAATPKPGLVDRNNSGAHEDMDFFTFLSSVSIFGSYFYDCAASGINFKGEDYRKLLQDIRPLGIKAENNMFISTGSINTHKGLIFSGGIIAVASGSLYREERKLDLISILERVKEIARGVSSELEDIGNKKNLTYGERLFKKYGIKGIRGEVEDGFQTVRNFSYPILKELIEEKEYDINDILVQSLLHLMSYTEDSNILGRHGREELKFAKESANQALKIGGIFTGEGKEFVEDLDMVFIKKYISPGGSADLLAITFMLYMIENGDVI